MTTWKLLRTGANFGAYNMAVDEELLARAQAGEQTPVLRFYAWNPPAVSLGRFQKAETAVNLEACKKRGIDVIRRITGGRAVFHCHELTYSIIARTDNPLFPPSVLGTYKIIASCLITGLRNLGIAAEAVSHNSLLAVLVKKRPKNPACFSSPSWYEIVVGGKKIIGSAQRRLSGAFLQHGSVLIDFDPRLEAEVIPGAGTEDLVTSVNQVLSRKVPNEEIIDAVLKGFSSELGLTFEI